MIKKHGRPVAALVPVEDLELIRELEDRIDLQDARKALAEAKGKFIPMGDGEARTRPVATWRPTRSPSRQRLSDN